MPTRLKSNASGAGLYNWRVGPIPWPSLWADTGRVVPCHFTAKPGRAGPCGRVWPVSQTFYGLPLALFPNPEILFSPPLSVTIFLLPEGLRSRGVSDLTKSPQSPRRHQARIYLMDGFITYHYAKMTCVGAIDVWSLLLRWLFWLKGGHVLGRLRPSSPFFLLARGRQEGRKCTSVVPSGPVPDEGELDISITLLLLSLGSFMQSPKFLEPSMTIFHEKGDEFETWTKMPLWIIVSMACYLGLSQKSRPIRDHFYLCGFSYLSQMT